MEQRDARLLRFGNRLAEEVPGFSVRIYRYATEKSPDALMFSRLAMKAGMISQFRKGNVTDRNMEDAADAGVLTYSQMKAATSGNLDLVREVEIGTELASLANEKAEHLRKKAAASKKLRETDEAPIMNAALEKEIESFSAAVEGGADGLFRHPDGMAVPLKEIASLEEWLNGFPERLKGKGSQDWYPAGAYRGLILEARPGP
ncbi:MAG: hypothetical protein LBO05_05765, partial [Deltaproteobacteria bacterium]|nr:hypothetical protein [Deltaproteobacteria bacterium]